MKTLVVTAAIIYDHDQFLIAQRKKGTHQEMLWEFPGGKVEPGESPDMWLAREIKEELNLTVEVGSIYHVTSHNYGDRHIILLCYLCSIAGGAAERIECHDFQWVTAAELTQFNFAPADIPVVEKLRREYLK